MSTDDDNRIDGWPNLRKNPNRHDPEYMRAIGKKGGEITGAKRRQRANFKKTMETILRLDMPEGKARDMLEKMGLDPSLEVGLIVSLIQSAIAKGDPFTYRVIAEQIGQNVMLADRKEQAARIERLKVETERLKAEVDAKTGATAKDEAQEQAKAIADMINNAEAERILSDFLGG